MKNAQYRRHEKLFDFLLGFAPRRLREYMIGRVYDGAFYAETRERKDESFRKVAAILSRRLAFETVLDIGCGTARLLAEFKKIGKEVLGCEISEAAIRDAAPGITVFRADATRPIRLDRQFDLVICIEVAEHVPKRRSRQLVENCASLGRQVCFTAAPRGQSGIGHINLQPYSYWIELFARQGFLLEAALGQTIAEQMRAADVLSWIPNNLMIFSRRPAGDGG